MPLLHRVLEVEAGKRFAVAAAALFLLGFLPLAFGSIATALFAAIGLIALWQAIRGETPLDFPYPARFAVIAALGYFALDAAGIIFYEDRARAWMPGVASLHFFLFPFILAALLRARGFDPLQVFVRGARVGAIASLILAIVQISDGLDRAAGGMINPIPFGSTAALFAFLSLIGIAEEGWRGRAFAVLAFGAGLAAAVLSEARGAWLALPVLTIIILFYLRARLGRRVAAIGVALLLAVTLLVVIAARDSLRERIEETLVMFQGFEFGRADRNEIDAFSLDQRALLMVYGLQAFGDRPLLGYGPQNAIAEVQALAAADGYTIETYGHLHNEFLTEAVGNGIAGLVTLLLVLAAPIVTALRSARDAGFADRLAFASLMTAGAALFGLTSLAFGHDITNSVYVSALLALCLGAVRSRPVPLVRRLRRSEAAEAAPG